MQNIVKILAEFQLLLVLIFYLDFESCILRVALWGLKPHRGDSLCLDAKLAEH